MGSSSWFARLEQAQTSYLLLATLAGTGLAVGVLYRLGVVGWALRVLGHVVRGGIEKGFLLWERLFGWASWGEFLIIVIAFLDPGWWRPVGPLPGLRVLCGLATLLMGAVACLAYMFIDLERNEVERGHKSVHNPMKGQLPAMNLERYGKQVRIPLLIAATVALIGGFALFNQGLHATIGRALVPGRRREKAADLRRFSGVCAHEDSRADRCAGSGQIASYFGRLVHSTSRMAGLRAAGCIQVLLHARVAPPDLCLATTGQTAGGDNCRFLEPARADP